MKLKKGFVLLFGLLTLLFVSGCNFFSPNITVTNISVDPSTFSGEYYLDDFDLTTIHIIVEMSDGTTESVVLNDTMISTDDLAKLSTLGTHTITIQYQGQSVSIDVTLSANTLPERFIYFSTDCDTAIDPFIAPIGSVVIAPTPPTRVGYTFEGWFTVDNSNQPYEFTLMPQNNLTLFAKWHKTENGFSYETLYHRATILSYSGTETTLILLDELDSFPITVIEANAFKNNTALQSLKVGANVAQIKNAAFQNMANLKSIELAGKTTQVGEAILYGCSQLETLIISSEAPYTLANYFGNLSDVPNTISKIKFANGSSGFDPTLTNSTINNITLELADDATKVHNSQFYGSQHLHSVIIPETILEIGNYGFFDSSVQYFYFKGNSQLTKIGTHAFDSLELEYFILPSLVTQIGYHGIGIFQNAVYTYATEKLPNWDNEWTYPSQKVNWGIKEHGVNNELAYVISNSDEANIIGQEENYDTLNVVIPDSINGYEVTLISPYAFYQSQLVEIQLGENIEVIDQYAFFEATQLVTIHFGQNSQLHTIESYAFVRCEALKQLHFPASLKYIYGASFDVATAIESITFPENSQLELIGNAAFGGCNYLYEIYIPKDAVLEQAAFGECPNLIVYIYVDERPSTWSEYWYLGGPNPKTIWGVKKMGSVGDIRYLINKDDEVMIIGLEKNSTLTALTIPEQIEGKPVTTIMDHAFMDCTTLLSVQLPTSLTSIQEYAFSGASSLLSIFIPNTVLEVGAYAFVDCTSITIYAQATSQPQNWPSDWHGFQPVVWGHMAPYHLIYYGYVDPIAMANVYLGSSQSYFITEDHRVMFLGEDNGIVEDRTSMFTLNTGEYITTIKVYDDITSSGHYMALTSQGRLFAWGNNTSGQLGDGTQNAKLVPIEITSYFNLLANEVIIDVAVGSAHNIAITSHQRVFSWGKNNFGQLGDNSTVDKLLPTDITGNFAFSSSDLIAQIDSAGNHNFLRTQSGVIYSWGYNFYGQLGNGDKINQLLPVNITSQFSLANGEIIQDIDTSSSHTFAISNLNHVYSWGNNQNAQLGYQTTMITPYQMDNQLSLQTSEFVLDVSVGASYSLVLTSSGRVLAFGSNSAGQLGANSTDQAISVPTDITSLFVTSADDKIVKIIAGRYHAIAMTSKGRIFGWGNNYSGQIGHLASTTQRKPIQITSLFQSRQELSIEDYAYQETINWMVPQTSSGVFSGWFTDETFETPVNLSQMPQNDVVVYGQWMENQHVVVFDANGGELISGDTMQLVVHQGQAVAPIFAREGYNFIGFDLAFQSVTENLTISAQWQIKTYAVTFDSSGAQVINGQLSQTINHGEDAIPPTLEKFGYHLEWLDDYTNITSDITIVAKWTINTYVITFDSNGGTLLTGSNTYTITHGETITAPTYLKAGHTFTGFDIDFSQISSDLQITAQWIINQYTLSFQTNNDTTIPAITQAYGAIVTEPQALQKVGYQFEGWYQDANFTQTFVFTTMPDENITLYAKWKANQHQIDYYQEAYVTQLFGGQYHSFVLLSNDRILGFGANGYCELGMYIPNYDGTPIDVTAAFPLSSGEKVLKIETHNHYTILLTTSGRIFSWGINNVGQLGNGTTEVKHAPSEITSFFNLNVNETIVDVFAGFNSAVAVTSQHRFFTWGDNSLGQLGNQTTIDSSLPIDVTSFIPFEAGEIPVQVVSDSAQTLILTSNHRIIAWGHYDLFHEKDGTPILTTHPTDITPLFELGPNEYVEQLSISVNFGMVLTNKDRLLLWGGGNGLQNEEGENIDTSFPTDITKEFSLFTNETIVSMTCNWTHSLVRTSANRIFTWGLNQFGQLGDGTKITRYHPVDVTNNMQIANDTIAQYMVFWEASYGLSAKGDLYMWGNVLFTDSVIYDSVAPLNAKGSMDLVGLMQTSNIDYDATISLLIPSKSGYTFVNWFVDAACTTLFTQTNMPDNDIQLYGKWEINTYQVTFNGNGGTLLYGNEQQEIVHGNAAAVPVYEKPGYLFTGFDGSITSITSDKQFTAQWIDLATVYYNVVFDGDGGTLISGDAQQSILHGQSAMEPVFVKAGFVFLGWDYAFDCITDHLTIQAIWELESGTPGLTYTLLADNTYEVSGYQGTNSFILIPSMYQGLMVTSIGEASFANNLVVEQIRIMENVKIIKNSAFSGITYLEKIYLPNSLETIQNGAFSGTGLVDIVIPNSVTFIGDGLFYGAQKLESFTLPTNLTTIPNMMFYRCKSLKTVVIPDGITRIGQYAFSECDLLESVIISNQVLTIDDYAFKYDANLSHVTFGSSVTIIGGDAFSDCIGLTELILPDSLVSTKWNSFWGCTGLTSVHFGTGMKTIGEFTFFGCTGLTSIVLPSSITKIGWGAFVYCSNLSSITIQSIIPPTLENNSSFAIADNFTIYVPLDSVTAYQSATYWSDYSQYIQPIQ
ncbi:MAG: leucine-rich repeat protein [Bacilli bacterium]